MGLIDFLASLGPWNWVFLGLLLGALEALIPGVHFLWFGLSALVVGGATMAGQELGFEVSWPLQLVMFAVVSFISVYAVRTYARPDQKSDLPNLNVRGAQMVGRTAVVVTPLAGGRGKVRLGDSHWVAEGPDLPEGTEVRITGVNDTVLVVEPVA